MKKATQVKYQSTGKQAIKMVFTPDPDTVAKVKTIPSRKYHAEYRYWSAPLTTEAAEKLRDWGFELCAKLTEFLKPKQAVVEPIDVPGLTGTLRPFQNQGVAQLVELDGRALLADDMGLGKTVQAIGYMQLYRAEVPVVVVCPTSVKTNWEVEMLKWMRPLPNIQILSGQSAEEEITGDYIIINYDVLPYWLERLVALQPRLIISDECHYWKNNSTKRTKAMKKLIKKSPRIIALSGTPFENAPIEIYNVVNAIDRNLFPSRWAFAHEYCDAKHNGWGWDFNGSSNTQALHKILTETVMIRRLKKDVLTELPAKNYVSIPIQITNRQEYQRAEDDFIDWLRGDLDQKYDKIQQELKTTVQAQAKKLGIKDTELLESFYDNEAVNATKEEKIVRASKAEAMVRMEALKQIAVRGKLDECISWISDFLESGEKLAVFCTHVFVIDALAKAFPGINLVIDGRVPANKRQAIVQQFQTNKKYKLFLGNIKACGEGITLTAASNAMVLEMPWTPGKFTQVVDRVHRITQTKQVTIYLPFAFQTIEEKLSEILERKQKMFDGVIDGVHAEDKQKNIFDEVLGSYK